MIHVAVDAQDLAELASATVADLVCGAVLRNGRCAVAVAGGTTPRGCYRLLASDHREQIPWPRVHLFWGDERMVPVDHPDSNQGMIRKELLAALDLPEANVHPVRTDLGSAEEAAARYHGEICGFFELEGSQLPRLDLVLLGLGEDGHTASLFPGCAALQETRRLVACCRPTRADHDRVTLTLPVINAAAAVVFLVSGERKADALRRVLDSGGGRRDLPAARVAPESGEALWLVDRAAAARLSRLPREAAR